MDYEYNTHTHAQRPAAAPDAGVFAAAHRRSALTDGSDDTRTKGRAPERDATAGLGSSMSRRIRTRGHADAGTRGREGIRSKDTRTRGHQDSSEYQSRKSTWEGARHTGVVVRAGTQSRREGGGGGKAQCAGSLRASCCQTASRETFARLPRNAAASVH